MNRNHGFHLIDCMMALFLVTLGLTSALGLGMKSRQNLVRIREHGVAWGILFDVMHQPVDRFITEPQRFYDHWGRPSTRGQAFFYMDIEALPWAGGTKFNITLRYTDFDGLPRHRVVSRYARHP